MDWVFVAAGCEEKTKHNTKQNKTKERVMEKAKPSGQTYGFPVKYQNQQEKANVTDVNCRFINKPCSSSWLEKRVLMSDPLYFSKICLVFTRENTTGKRAQRRGRGPAGRVGVSSCCLSWRSLPLTLARL